MVFKIKNLNQPYPIQELKPNQWLTAILFSVFIVVFLILFQPFGLNGFHNNYKILFLSGYGGVTFVALVFNFFGIKSIFPKIFLVEKWTALKEIIWVLWIFFTIGLGNFLYSGLFFSFTGHFLNDLLVFQIFTLAIGILPVSILVMLSQNKMLKKNLLSATEINSSIPGLRKLDSNKAAPIHLKSENEKDELLFLPEDLLFVESVGNYVKVHFLTREKVETTLLRNSMKNIDKQLEQYPFYFRCHRAYLVNLSRINKVTGNAQGLRLILEETEQTIPVSRGYINSFRERMEP